ncbi:MAG: hypothetical protein ACJAZI_000361 [Cycloclasticus sp.]|jgi:hypothetical protein
MNHQKRKNIIAVIVLVSIAAAFYIGSFVFLTNN